MSRCDFGLIGLAVMGQNLVLNAESKGFSVAVYNRTKQITDKFVEQHPNKNIFGFHTFKDFISNLKSPRIIQLMVKAGPVIDQVIEDLIPHLNEGDLIVDGGNSLYTDTIKREEYCKSKNIRYMGAGVSGGEEGALKGPSIMPSGDEDSWELVKPIFEAIAAKVDDSPCVTYIGKGGSGHFVKMVHNGIEYGDMQLICEAYNLLKAAGISNLEIAAIFDEWNSGDLESYLIEITSKIFLQKDDFSDQSLVDMIVDKAGQKGTGRWTALSAIDYAVPLSTISASVEARILSSMKDDRISAASVLSGPDAWTLDLGSITKENFIGMVHDSLFASKIVSYAQGLNLIATIGIANSWHLDLSGIAKIWRGGCIIRAKFLSDISKAFQKNPELKNLMMDGFFSQILQDCQQRWRQLISIAVINGIPTPALSASLSYYDSYRTKNLPANLLQAQRDFFGAHGYERVDREQGDFFHTESWPSLID